MKKERTILIIEDEPDLCLLLGDYFSRRKYTVYLSHTLSEGMDILKNRCPSVLFLDNNLPDGAGWPLAADIARLLPTLFIVLMSAFHPESPAMPDAARFQVIEKPMSRKDLDRLAGLMENNEALVS